MKVRIDWANVLDVERAFSDMFARSSLSANTLALNIIRVDGARVKFEAFTSYAFLEYVVGADIVEDFTPIAVGLESFVGICSYGDVEGGLTMAKDKGKMKLTINGSHYRLPLLPASRTNLGEIPKREDGELVNPTALAESINKVLPFASKDDNRMSFQNVLLDPVGGSDIRAVATDGATLYMHENPGILAGKVHLQPSSLKQFAKLLRTFKERDCSMMVKDQFLWFMWETATMALRLASTEFPDYRKIYPAGDGKIAVVSRESLLNALRRISLACPTGKQVKVECSSTTISLTTNSEKADAYEQVVADSDQKDMHGPYYFDHHKLLKVVSKMGGDELALRFYGGSRPLAIQDKNRSRSLLVPMSGPI